VAVPHVRSQPMQSLHVDQPHQLVSFDPDAPLARAAI
jgi:hypothetical protein